MKDLFTPDMMLSDMIDINFSLLQILPRVGMDLKYSGLKVSEACEKCGIDTRTFILICNVYSYPDLTPSEEEIEEEGDIDEIVRYLHGSHEFYTGHALSALGSSMLSLLADCDEKRKEAIMKFFYDYEAELVKHFAYEEEVLFKYIADLKQGKHGNGYSIDNFEASHGNVEEKLVDMKNIVMKYLPSQCPDELKTHTLLSIYLLLDDLHRHTFVENNILVPLVRNFENNGK